MELKTHNIYIFKWKKSSHNAPFKGQVEDQTEETIKITNLDTNISFRMMKKDFSEQWEAIELVKDFMKDLKETLRNTEMKIADLRKAEDNFYKGFPTNFPYRGSHCGNSGCFCSGICKL